MNARDLLAAMHERARWLDPTYIGSDLHQKVVAELATRDARTCSECGQHYAPTWPIEVRA